MVIKRRTAKSTGTVNQVAKLVSGALTATLFLLAIASAYYIKTNPTVLTNFATKLEANTLTKPIGTYIKGHANQTIGAIITLGAAFSVPLAYQAPVAIGGLIFTFEIAKPTTSFWEYFGFAFSTLLLIRAPNNRIRIFVIVLIAILIAYEVVSLPSVSNK